MKYIAIVLMCTSCCAGRVTDKSKIDLTVKSNIESIETGRAEMLVAANQTRVSDKVIENFDTSGRVTRRETIKERLETSVKWSKTDTISRKTNYSVDVVDKTRQNVTRKSVLADLKEFAIITGIVALIFSVWIIVIRSKKH